jgi:hypothetical protein
MDAHQADRLAGWWATLSPEQRAQAVAVMRSLPPDEDDDKADDAWRSLVPQWISVTGSAQPPR